MILVEGLAKFGETIAQPRLRTLLLWGLAVVGFALTASLLHQHGIHSVGTGLGGGDVFAYWVAGRNLATGGPIYGVGAGGYAAYLYPPPIAQLFSLVAGLPLPVVVWGWRATELAGLAVAVGGIRNAGIACLLWPPVIAELDAGNVHLLIAAAVAAAIRGDARWVFAAALTKFASLAAFPLGWVADRRGSLAGIGIAILLVAVSFAVAPTLWLDWWAFSIRIPSPGSTWYNLGEAVPLPVRLCGAAFLALAAIRWPRLAAPAATLALPILWLHGLSVLVAAATPIRRRA